VKRCTRIVYDPNDLTGINNQHNVEYIPSGETDAQLQEAKLHFSNLLASELQLRWQPVFGSIEDRRNRLKTLLKVEQKLEMIIRAINRSGEGKEAALMLISQAIPCIMHLENRVGEKMITVLLSMAADIYRKKTNTTTINTRFASNIQSVVNTRILGSVHHPKHWKVPFNEKGDCVSKVSFSNSKTRLFIDNLHVLIDFTR
jgi:hypothetical protein